MGILCRECSERMSEFLDGIPEGKLVDVDLPEDVYAAEKVIGIMRLRELIRIVNEHSNWIEFRQV